MDWASYRGVLLDLDGVITSTAGIHRQAWQEVFDEVLPMLAPNGHKVYGEEDYQLYLDGRPRYAGVAALLEAHDVELPWGDPDDPPGPDTVCGVGNMKNARFLEILEREGVNAYPGTLCLLDHLHALGIRTAVVTSSRNAAPVLAAAGFSNGFDTVVDGNVVAELGLDGKPAPDPFLEAARRIEVDPSQAVVVEDAIGGVQAGAAGGFGLVVGVSRVVNPRILAEEGADLVVDDLSELCPGAP